jgi:ANTAR domain
VTGLSQERGCPARREQPRGESAARTLLMPARPHPGAPPPPGAQAPSGAAPRGVVAELQQRVLEAESRADNLQRAMLSNRRIGMAVGILLTRCRVTEDQAFELLRRRSMHCNQKLREIAEEVILTGTFPGLDDRRGSVTARRPAGGTAAAAG